MEEWFVLDTFHKHKTSGDMGMKDTEETNDLLQSTFKIFGPVFTEDDSKEFVSHVKKIASLLQFKSFGKQMPFQSFTKTGVSTDVEEVLIGYFKLLASGDKKHTISSLRIFSSIPKIEEHEMFTDTFLHNYGKTHLEQWFNDNDTLVEDNTLLSKFIVRCISHVVANEKSYPNSSFCNTCDP